MIVKIPLDYIDPNPYQARTREKPLHVQRIAASLAERGLIHTPPARIVIDGQPAPAEAYGYDNWGSVLAGYPDARVQLAAGHTRLAGFRHNLEHTVPSTWFDWQTMPLDLRHLDELGMFDLGLDENDLHRTLSDIDRANAMLIYRDKLGKTSPEIGARFKMSESGVRNLLRLLNLPEYIQIALEDGQISQSVARSLLSITEMDADLRQVAERAGGELRPDQIIRDAMSGELTASNVYERLEHIRALQSPALFAPPPVPAPVIPDAQPAAVVDLPPANRPAPAPPAARIPTPDAYEPRPAAPPRPPEPEPEPELPAPPRPWEECTVTMTITWWPGEDNKRSRMLAARVDDQAPLMRMSGGNLVLDIDSLYGELKVAHNKKVAEAQA